MSKEYDLNAWRVLAAAQASGSVSSAARSLGMEPSTAIRLVEALDASMKFPLFVKARRPFQLTERGAQAVQKMTQVLDAHRQVLLSLNEDVRDLKGLIRLSCPIGHSRRNILPIVCEFQRFYPDVDFSISIASPIEDVYAGKIDVALTAGSADRPGLVSRYRDHSVFIPVASKKYIEEHGFPHHPDDLRQHTGLVYNGRQRTKTEQLQRNDQVAVLKWKRKIEIGDIIAVKEGVLAGLGCAVDVPIAHCYRELLDGRLVCILDGWRRASIDCFVVTSEEGYRIRRIRTFVDWLAAKSSKESVDRDRRVSQKLGLIL